ncbi:endonuclease VII [Gordonia phage GMA6]|uniref:Recombination endonuclease VII n=1 Tax=Gordonia phage GMA6 TaxID=1647285 RepID=A0A0K0NKS5_9CAUD|nr:endonuclease VII [Gordonia phage GMA6]AKL88331.1 hypothetical protein GMA6_50 [Gordonia phage GMA6]
MNTCKTCNASKGAEEFPPSDRYKSGHLPSCRACYNSKARKRYADNEEHRELRKAHARKAHTKRVRTALDLRKDRLSRYGVTVTWFSQRLKRQRGRCAICRRKMPYTLCVDHCHETGKVRGLLCISCNRGLGFFADDPKRMQRAIEYLERSV